MSEMGDGLKGTGRQRTGRTPMSVVHPLRYVEAIGTILGACFLLGRAAIRDRLTALMRVASRAALFHWKVNNPLLIAVGAAIGQLVDS